MEVKKREHELKQQHLDVCLKLQQESQQHANESAAYFNATTNAKSAATTTPVSTATANVIHQFD